SSESPASASWRCLRSWRRRPAARARSCVRRRFLAHIVWVSAGSAASASSTRDVALDVELLRVLCAFHDELEARARVLAHELVDAAIGHDLIVNLDAQEPPRFRIQRRLPQNLRHHLAEALEARDLRLGAAVDGLEDLFLVAFVERPVRFLAGVDAV